MGPSTAPPRRRAAGGNIRAARERLPRLCACERGKIPTESASRAPIFLASRGAARRDAVEFQVSNPPPLPPSRHHANAYLSTSSPAVRAASDDRRRGAGGDHATAARRRPFTSRGTLAVANGLAPAVSRCASYNPTIALLPTSQKKQVILEFKFCLKSKSSYTIWKVHMYVKIS